MVEEKFSISIFYSVTLTINCVGLVAESIFMLVMALCNEKEKYFTVSLQRL